MKSQSVITKSIRMKPDESEALTKLSQKQGVSEAAIMQQFVREGLAKQRLAEAITYYQNGEADLSAAARYAQISVYQMMTEVERRDISFQGESQKFIDGMKTLVEMFGGSDALRRSITQLEQEEGLK